MRNSDGDLVVLGVGYALIRHQFQGRRIQVQSSLRMYRHER